MAENEVFHLLHELVGISLRQAAAEHKPSACQFRINCSGVNIGPRHKVVAALDRLYIM